MSMFQNAETTGFRVSNFYAVWDIYIFIIRFLEDRTQFKHRNHLCFIYTNACSLMAILVYMFILCVKQMSEMFRF